jgi:benzoylformate decarboxylase
MSARTVRDAAIDVMRRHGMTRIFGNPGSTEIPFLTELPEDFEFVLALNEGSVVGMATGYALARGVPSFVNLHTAPGLGNAVNAIANARDCRAPIVIMVGQQDRRQIALRPFLTGYNLERVAGDYPVWTNLPARAQDVPGALARAWHEALHQGGPAIVVVPMGDWEEPVDEDAFGAPQRVLSGAPFVPAAAVSEFAALLGSASAPALVVGAGSDSEEGWAGVVALAERLGCPVWQEGFGSRAGFPQDHPLFAGQLPWRRSQIREALGGSDLVVAIGTLALHLYLYEPGPFLVPGTRIAVITAHGDEAFRSAAEVAVLAAPGRFCSALAGELPERERERARGPLHEVPPAPPPPGAGEPLLPGHVLAALAERVPRDVVLMEETPSSQPELFQRIPARAPLGLISCPNGGLGFGLSGAIGLRMGLPDRPVIAVLGDGAAMYTIQALWSAARYRVGLLLIVMSNGRYAVMDGLAERAGGRGPWPSFEQIDIVAIAGALGCPARRIETHAELIAALDEVIPSLAERQEPLLVEVALQ